jgi:TonB family protein
MRSDVSLLRVALVGAALTTWLGPLPVAGQGTATVRDAATPGSVDEAAGPLERVAVLPTLDVPAPKRTNHVPPAWPADTASTVRLRVHLVLDASGHVAEARVVRKGAQAGDAQTTAVAAAVLNAVRQWTFEPPTVAPLLIATYVGPADAEGMVMPSSSQRPPLRVGGNIAPPTKIHHVSPEYPPEALAANVGGVVIAEVTIDANGLVADVRILRSVTGLDDAAVAAVRQWRYTPTRLNGEPVPIMMTITVNFTMP